MAKSDDKIEMKRDPSSRGSAEGKTKQFTNSYSQQTFECKKRKPRRVEDGRRHEGNVNGSGLTPSLRNC